MFFGLRVLVDELNFMRRLLPRSTYAQNVITLMTGTGLAQAIPIAISPILTRLYTPEDFGIFALYTSIASIGSIFVTGRYDLAIMLPKKDRDAFQVVVLSACLSVIISIFLFVFVFFFNDSIVALLGVPGISKWLYWVPISTMFIGVYGSLSYWCNRKSRFGRLAISRVTQTSTSSFSQLFAAHLKTGSHGLVFGQLIGQFTATLMIARDIKIHDKSLIKNIRILQVIALAKRYKNFPRYLIIAHGFNAGSGQMPMLLLGGLFNATTAGYYSLIQRVMGVPMTFVANAIGEVFRQEASQAYVHTGSCRLIYIKTFKRLFFLALIPFAFFFVAGPSLFAWFFGEPWRVAGEYSRILLPMFFFQFITTPITQLPLFAEKQKIDLFWQISLFFLVLLAFIYGYFINDVKWVFIIYSGAYVFMYIAAFVISFKLSNSVNA